MWAMRMKERREKREKRNRINRKRNHFFYRRSRALSNLPFALSFLAHFGEYTSFYFFSTSSYFHPLRTRHSKELKYGFDKN